MDLDREGTLGSAGSRPGKEGRMPEITLPMSLVWPKADTDIK